MSKQATYITTNTVLLFVTSAIFESLVTCQLGIRESPFTNSVRMNFVLCTVGFEKFDVMVGIETNMKENCFTPWQLSNQFLLGAGLIRKYGRKMKNHDFKPSVKLITFFQ